MMNHLISGRTCLALFAALGMSCANVSNTVDDVVTVDVGAEALRAVEIEHSVTLGVDRIPACLDFSAMLPAHDTTIALSNSPEGCALTVAQPGLVLMDEEAVARAREQSGNFDVGGIRGVTLELQQFELSTAEAQPLELSQFLDALTVIMDGEVVLDRVPASELDGDGTLTRELPASVVDKLKASLEENKAAAADVVISLWLRGDGLPDFPETLNLRLVMQPGLQVNVVDAVL